MDEESELKCNLLSIVLLHVVDSCEVLLKISSNEPFHEVILVLLKQISEDFGFFFVHREMGKDHTLSYQALEVDLLPKNGLYDFDSLPSIKLIVG